MTWNTTGPVAKPLAIALAQGAALGSHTRDAIVEGGETRTVIADGPVAMCIRFDYSIDGVKLTMYRHRRGQGLTPGHECTPTGDEVVMLGTIEGFTYRPIYRLAMEA